MYLDFKKVFDSVAHNELLLKLWKFGICGSLWLWTKAYLTNRRSRSVTLKCSTCPLSVPQGNILGPLPFTIFVNDLPSSVSSSSIFLFANDAKRVMHVPSLSDCQLLQNDLTRLVEWTATWNLLLNEGMCSVTHFTASQSPLTYDYSISGKLLPSKSTQRDLSVSISADL